VTFPTLTDHRVAAAVATVARVTADDRDDQLVLHLKYSPTVANAPLFAADIVESAFKISGVDLDYRPGSLWEVDRIVEGFRSEGLSRHQVGETLFGFGCYVGEVFVRNAGGVWRPTQDTPMGDFAGAPFVIRLPEGAGYRHVNPLDKVFKRLDNGPEDDLTYFYRVFTTGPPAGPTG
jgi:hypothetical protein